jgi:predicted protein tyrosine phosphatase
MGRMQFEADPVRRGRGLARPALAVLAVALVAWLAWDGWIRDNLAPRRFGVVEQGAVYRSGRLTPAAMARVKARHGIRTIVDLGAHDRDPAGEVLEARSAKALGIERHVFPLEGDGTGNPNAYVEALRIMADPRKQPVLVHCATGAQRTGAACLLYGRLVQGRDEEELAADLGRFGHDPTRNTRMAPYLAQWSEAIARAFRSGGSIEGQPSLAPAGETVVIPLGRGRPAARQGVGAAPARGGD